MESTGPANRKLLLVGWDGADWALIKPLIERGLMPNLAGLLERGVMGNLTSIAPLISPSLWTSIATGKRPDKHGVVIGAELNRELGVYGPVSSRARHAAPFWQILARHGRAGHVIHWPVSHPAEDVRGVMISDRYAQPIGPVEEPWPLDPSVISPARLRSPLSELRVHPAEIDAEQLRAFVPRLDAVDGTNDGRVALIASLLAETASVHAAATWTIEREPWDFIAVHYGALEPLSNLFLRYQPPLMPGISESECALYGDVVTTAYRFHDLMLGRLLQLAGGGVTTMLVSDHGFRTGHLRPVTSGPNPIVWHRGLGVVCLAGPGIRQDELVHQASILDVTPTILTLFGLPVGDDMDGQPLLSAWEQPPIPPRIPSWDQPEVPQPPAGTDGSLRQHDGEEALAELRELGYADTPLPSFDRLERMVRRSETYHLALTHLHCGRYGLALDLLQPLLDEERDNTLLRMQAAYCSIQAGDLEKGRALLEGVTGTSELSPERALLTAMMLMSEHRMQEALDCLETARQTELREPQIFCFIGHAYLRLQRYDEAEAEFARALQIDGDCIAGHFGLALVSVEQQHWEEAADRALAAVRLDHHQPDAHYLLGIALVRLERPDWAVQAFNTASALRPDWAAPRTWAARLRWRVPMPAVTP